MNPCSILFWRLFLVLLMKILENTPVRLKLRAIPFGTAALLGGITLLRMLLGWALFNTWFGKPDAS